jgi:hypothetical protein
MLKAEILESEIRGQRSDISGQRAGPGKAETLTR